jgi:hypothetical protein
MKEVMGLKDDHLVLLAEELGHSGFEKSASLESAIRRLGVSKWLFFKRVVYG